MIQTSDPHLIAAASGLGLGLSLIVAIGAQNAFVLRQGLRGEHVLGVVAICALSDLVLILAGVAGAGEALQAWPAALVVVRVLGAVVLAGYAVLAARRALRPADGEAAALRADTTGSGTALTAALVTCLALTWLNPHVYLDTVVLLGSIASTHGDERWWFGAGAGAGSVIWFTALGFGARLLRPLFAKPVAWRVLDGIIAVMMAALATSLLLGA
ncbi:L-lysine exporter family protein LysE/ArgO [Quadrisphaera granulorum]|uniref:L-lysine exporter family protein LysE/ArgO n=1 Tax=Quadrisphaera granulorum TaxID=317664 RepID=A0A316ABH1_9ACTN|nr:LysE/ArgO family amino acid transporter [Quadrisphaera granulorum]PWJ54204.1 L-lysine exporter family protein LysE/ArgO [Quadrisphaera granulorum]SZE96343.1 L-lysine exporter family protein LysE/ArgO [Quadrisphaera granulorum]